MRPNDERSCAFFFFASHVEMAGSTGWQEFWVQHQPRSGSGCKFPTHCRHALRLEVYPATVLTRYSNLIVHSSL